MLAWPEGVEDLAEDEAVLEAVLAEIDAGRSWLARELAK